MKVTKRTLKYSTWYETTYWRNGSAHSYVTKTHTEHHDFLHDRAKNEGLQAITTQWNRTAIFGLGLFGEQIKITNLGKFAKCR